MTDGRSGTGTTGRPLLGGRYEVGPTLGYGGMAEVFLGRDVRLGRDVAVKVLKADLARDPAFQSRFRREAQAAASLNHPSIVAVYDTGEDVPGPGRDPAPFIVMEYVEGRTLRDALADGPLLLRRALEVVADVCTALEQAHRAGIVHRDVKPGNVMLTPSGRVKVMDFGIARAVTASQATQTAAVIGTAQYLSPEQARGEHVDARSDVYSTGCLLYELLTGVPPFTGDTPVAIAYQHVREDPTPPSAYDDGIPADVDAVVLKAMAKNPANRYQSAAEMREDLERVLAGQAVAATPVLPGAPPPPPAVTTALLRTPDEPPRRRRGIAYALLALAVLGVFLAAALVTRALLGETSTATRTPDVVGLQLAQADLRLAEEGLVRGQVTQAFSDEPVGQVLAQQPVAGIAIAEGGTVDLTVSRGKEKVTVPQVVGLQRDRAQELLESRKLVVRDVIRRDVDAPEGLVLAIDPPAGTVLDARSEVTIAVASGEVPVPSVVGQPLRTAIATLGEAGLQVTTVPLETLAAPPDTVVGQAPSGGTARRGSTVELTVAVEPRPSPSPTPTPTPTPTPVDPTPTPVDPTPTGPTPTTPVETPSPSPTPTP